MTATRDVAASAPAAERGAVVFPLQLRRVQRMLLARELSESLPAALALFAAGLAGLGDSTAGLGGRALAVAELASSAWMLLLLGRTIRGAVRRRPRVAVTPVSALPDIADEHAGVDWAGLAGATMLAVEVWHHWHGTGRVQRPLVMVAAFTLFMATGGRLMIARAVHARFGDRRPRLALTSDGVEYRGSRRRRFAARWDEVARVEHDENAVTLALHDGRTFALRARDHVDGGALVSAVREALPGVLPPVLR